RITRVEASVEVGPEAYVLRRAGGAGVVDEVLDHVLEGGAARLAKVVLVEAHAHDAAAAGDLRHGLVGQLAVAGHKGTGVAVRGHDRSAPQLERVGHGCIRHVAEVEDHLLPAHRLQQLPPEVAETSWRAGAAAVAGPAPCRADDPDA